MERIPISKLVFSTYLAFLSRFLEMRERVKGLIEIYTEQMYKY